MADLSAYPAYLSSPEYIGDKLMSAGISMLVVITIVYILFNISRIFCAQHNGWEIWTVYPLAYLAAVGICLSDIIMVKIAGGGHHLLYLEETNPTAVVNWLKIQTGDELLYMSGVTFPRIAMCILYLRIFTDKKVRALTWVVLAVVVLHWFGSGILALFLLCRPFAFYWDKTIEGGWCGDTLAGFKWVSLPNIIIDVALILLPIQTLWRLQVHRAQKIGIFVTFMTGCLGIIGSMIRMVEFFTIDFASDLTYLGIWTMIYTTLEPSAYFVCACLPGIRPLANSLYHKSGLRDAIRSHYITANSTGKGSKRGVYDLSATGGKSYGTHSAMVTTGHKKTSSGGYSLDHGTHGDFIRLDETFQVESTSRLTSPGWDAGHAV